MIAVTVPMPAEAQTVESVTYYMGGIPRGKIVGGIVHNVTVELSQPASNVTLRAFLDSGFSQSNRTNNYSWSWDNGFWKDNLYDYYMKNESARYDDNYCFHISIDSTATTGTWCWTVSVDGTEEQNATMSVEEPVAGIRMSSPTFYPRIMPYGEGTWNSWNSESPNNSTSLTTENIGNVPLDFEIYYDSMNTLFTTTNNTGTYLPGETRTHYIEFQAQGWSPRKFNVNGLVNGKPRLVMTPDTVAFALAAQTSFDVEVTVARPGYQVFQMEGVTAQYKKFYTSSYKEDLEIDMYLTGNKSIYLEGVMEDLRLNHITFFGEEYDEPLRLDLQDDVEQYVRANVTCSESPAENQASILAYANFNIEPVEGGQNGTFTSTVMVAAVPGADDNVMLEPNTAILIVLVAVFSALGVFLFRAHKKAELERSRELEERIRKKKERARKRK